MRRFLLVLGLAISACAPAARAGTSTVPIRVGVTIAVPCRIATPSTVAANDVGNAVVRNSQVVENCTSDPQVTVSQDASERGGYVVTVSF